MTSQTGTRTRQKNDQEVLLLRRTAELDRAAITELYLNYHPRLFKFVFRLTHSYAMADELVNDIMLLVWQKASTFRGDAKVSTWIFGIAYRQTMHRVTRKQLEDSNQPGLENISTDDGGVLETEDRVLSGLQKLPAAQQLAVVLVFYLGLSYRETAEITGCPINTVNTRMFHARRKL